MKVYYSFLDYMLCFQCQTVYDSVYFCSWLNFPEKIKRNIRIVQIRFLKTFDLKAGGVIRINLDSFIEVSFKIICE